MPVAPSAAIHPPGDLYGVAVVIAGIDGGPDQYRQAGPGKGGSRSGLFILKSLDALGQGYCFLAGSNPGVEQLRHLEINRIHQQGDLTDAFFNKEISILLAAHPQGGDRKSNLGMVAGQQGQSLQGWSGCGQGIPRPVYIRQCHDNPPGEQILQPGKGMVGQQRVLPVTGGGKSNPVVGARRHRQTDCSSRAAAHTLFGGEGDNVHDRWNS